MSEEDREAQEAELAAAETYQFMKAAQWMNVQPWELLKQPPWWVGIANACRTAENIAEKNRIESRKPKVGRKPHRRAKR